MAAATGRAAGAAPAGYTALAVKFSERQRSHHCLLVKEHQVREGADTAHPPRRTLFVLNVPPYCGPAVLSLRARAVCGHL
uniref:Rrp7 RRM-like N-terminal domain-containing protein n=1 Tax=Taeniopygia guttata TaxID=59729 RepID=B5FYD0_TAEGU|nr:putative RIKEN cDNA 1110014J01 variant 2 [Taeniopygia guttata]